MKSSNEHLFCDLERFASRTALKTEAGDVTYGELLAVGRTLTQPLESRKLVMILCTNSVASIAAYVCCLRMGVVPIMVSNGIDRALLQRLFSVYRPNAVLAPEGGWQGRSLAAANGYRLYATEYADSIKLSPELALLLTTSGSTGSPKLVRLTYANLMANTASIIEYLGIVPTDVAITTLPMNYTYGLSIINTHLCAGASILVTEKTFLERDIWDVFRQYGVTNFGAIPYTFEMLKRLSFFQQELPSLRYVTQAGGKLDRALQLQYAEYLRSVGKSFIVMYGATEATARMAYLPAEHAVEKAGSMGVAIPGGRFELMDVDNSIITEPDKPGELIYYGENVSPGYAESQEDLSLGDERHGRLETGDLACCDPDGFYTIVGRKSRFLKMFGNRVNLMEVESILRDKGWDTACAGKDNHMEIYTVAPDTAEIQSYVTQSLRLHPSAVSVYQIAEIPRNEAGKIQYVMLKHD